MAALCAGCETEPETDPVRDAYIESIEICRDLIQNLPDIAEGELQERVESDRMLQCLRDRGVDDRIIHRHYLQDY